MSDPTGKALEAAAGCCCPDWAKHSRWLLTLSRGSRTNPINYCPWCGKGHTQPAARVATVESSSMIGKTSRYFGPRKGVPMITTAAARAMRRTELENWPTGHPHCTTCHGKGYTLKKVGCCNLEPVKCPCTQIASTLPPGELRGETPPEKRFTGGSF